MSFILTIQAVDNDSDFYISIGISKPLWPGGATRFVVATYNFEIIATISSALFLHINAAVARGEFSCGVFASGKIRKWLTDLNTHLYALRVRDTDLNLGQLISLATETVNEPIRFVVGRQLETIPWEITSPGRTTGAKMLGSLAFVCGNLFDVDDQTDSDRNVVSRRAVEIPFEDAVHIRAAGDDRLAGANDEESFIRRPAAIATGTIAPHISSSLPASEADFFQHFAPDKYGVVHIFSHCDYPDQTAGFRLHVSSAYPLGVTAFYRNNAFFQPRAFHFLNVCSGAPTPANRRKSLVEYMASQQNAAAIIASLVTVRSDAAVEMARAFYRHFLPAKSGTAGRSIADAMFMARQELWHRGIPAGFLYRAYGHPETRLSPARPIAS
jgi:hypothetical protein